MCETLYDLSQSLEEAEIIIPSDIRGAELPQQEENPEITKPKPNF